MSENKAKRYNTGKNRYELIPSFALEKLAEVYCRGAHKYSVYEDENGVEVLGKDIPFSDLTTRKLRIKEDGSQNWRKGLDWMGALGSVERHIEAFKVGEDIDKELGTYHLGNAVWGLMSILEYYRIYPQGDSRLQWWKKPLKKVWLDLDGIIFDYEQHFLNWFNLPLEPPNDWNDYRFRDGFHKTFDNKEFWLNCPIIFSSEKISYPIAGYCTSRPIDDVTIRESLNKNGFPAAEIINIYGKDLTKAQVLKENGCDIMVDDSITNFISMNSAGILCYLMTRPHNIKYDCRYMRVNNIEEFFEKIKT